MTPDIEHAPAGKRSILFVINSLNLGGPQKALIGLLQRLDQSKVDVSLLVLQGRSEGDLGDYVPEWVRLIVPSRLYRAATMPKGELCTSLRLLAHGLPPKVFAQTMWAVARAALTGRLGTRVRQALWRASAIGLPTVPGTYDASIGILGQSTYAVVDLVNAQFKYHWVRSDTRILRRNEEIEAEYFNHLDGALAVSNEVARIFVSHYPFLSGRVSVYKNDVPDMAGMSPALGGLLGPTDGFSAGSVRILTVSRLDSLKGLELAVEACHRLKASGVDVAWVVLGEGPHRSVIEESIGALGVEEQFKLVGAHPDPRQWLEAADVYVHPSRAEGRSNAVEEAKAAGLPIVACRYPTVADQITDGVSGLVVDFSAVAIEEAVSKLLSDRSMAGRVAREAKREFEEDRGDAMALVAALTGGSLSRPNAEE